MSKVTSIHHINYVVKDLAVGVSYFEKMLEQAAQFEDLPSRRVKTARFLLGGVYLVLVCPQDAHSDVAKVLDERGEGLFLLSLATSNIAETKGALANQDIHLTEAGERDGLLDWKVADLRAPNALGPILQLCQSNQRTVDGSHD